ncbi:MULTISPECIES: fumarylacetoacetate hydrolase family protein [Streptomyces]|uniref:Fumarylacetoacetate hydrolase family protein n=2 Tax=Streptomyces TaxID=1883 RepID=A0ABD5JRI7_9ACTN|nr:MULTISPECIES: fumarylacetoacetate hydrolase family protein [unclassified Streptomyces]MEE4590157.1 fumarylacetoacetate hydrolase family protein [Streptomyces sp. DSM 41602]WTA78618.1 fumarylacetoacetate hydrolase family protein [Streptomyces antimycoticus]QTI87321.1 fumarylacetoacetate hydrolase family protein [Streptomyces sp. AgN23]RSS32199.1 fumarylacetoacetate hydrolase family protein [Streptomyces sp. WAC05858]WTB02867.1 fumarylacetoacetate hydrolase family protein [Streptomyces antimy
MRLVTFRHPLGATRFGVLHNNLVIDPDTVLRTDRALRQGPHAADRGLRIAREMVAFFESGATGRGLAERAIELVDEYRRRGDTLSGHYGLDGVLPLDEVRLLAPVPRPRRIRDYLTYNEHAAGSGMEVPAAFSAMPICYKCNVETVIGPDEPLLWPSYTDQLDFELELGFFTSGGGRNLTSADAARRIAGVTIFNDVSARDIQMFEMGMSIGPSKGKDFCTAMGPCVLTMDEVDEWSVRMSARVNGEVWATGTTANRSFSFSEVLAWASLDEDVYPGEFFGVGTVGGGCGLELDRWIQPGDILELDAAGIGTLRNPVGHKQVVPEGAGLATYHGSPAVHVQHAE